MTKVGTGDLNARGRLRVGLRVVRRSVARSESRQAETMLADAFRRQHAFASTDLQGLLDALQRMLGQQPQHADVMASARMPTMAGLKAIAQLAKRRRKAPIAIDVCVVQVGRLAIKRRQIVQRIEHLFALAVRSLVSRHEDVVANDLNSIDVRLDGYRLKGVSTRHAVAILIPGRRLVLVDLADFAYLRIERVIGQLQRMLFLHRETLADCGAPAGHRSLQVFTATGAQVGVQLVQIFDAGNRRRPASLDQLDSILDMRFFVRTGRHAEQRIEVVMARQRQPALVQLPLAALKDRRGYGPRIVPP
ncbi:MAG: hypothetical protein AAF967_10635 [Pseudomonadota bacterium]